MEFENKVLPWEYSQHGEFGEVEAKGGFLKVK
jgi:hypothetical protein